MYFPINKKMYFSISFELLLEILGLMTLYGIAMIEA